MEKLKIIVFNVGQGDNILIEFPNSEFGIIDFNFDESINPYSEPPAITYLKLINKKNVREKGSPISINFLHLSHYHLDHFKGFVSTLRWIDLENIPLKHIYFPSFPHNRLLGHTLFHLLKSMCDNNIDWEKQIAEIWPSDSSYLKSFHQIIGIFQYLDEKLITYEDVFRPLSGPSPVDDFANVNLFCLSPIQTRINQYITKSTIELFYRFIQSKFDINSEFSFGSNSLKIDQNELSVLLKFTFNNDKFLFTGDACSKVILESSNLFTQSTGNKNDIKSLFIKVPHHGSDTSSSKSVWERLILENSDSYIIISAGNHSGYKHPHEVTITHIDEICNEKKSNNFIFSTNFKPNKPTLPIKYLNWHLKDATKQIDNEDILQSRKNLDPFIGYEFSFTYSPNRNVMINTLYHSNDVPPDDIS
jgi:beta-lactamase superfamily II metal-dependent hydrolase